MNVDLDTAQAMHDYIAHVITTGAPLLPVPLETQNMILQYLLTDLRAELLITMSPPRSPVQAPMPMAPSAPPRLTLPRVVPAARQVPFAQPPGAAVRSAVQFAAQISAEIAALFLDEEVEALLLDE